MILGESQEAIRSMWRKTMLVGDVHRGPISSSGRLSAMMKERTSPQK